MESLERFRQSRSVIEDFTSRTLAAISSDYGRLYYMSSLRDPETRRYRHDGLAELYSESAVQAALLQCHEELFSRILETPLRVQEGDLRTCLDSAGDRVASVVDSWLKTGDYRSMCPEGLPGYLSALFCSNVGAILEVMARVWSNSARAA